MKKPLSETIWFYVLLGAIGTVILFLSVLWPWTARAQGFEDGKVTMAAAIIANADLTDHRISNDLFLATLWMESCWKQSKNGKPYRCNNHGSKYSSWGIGQINDDPRSRYPGMDYKRLKYDLRYNVKCSAIILQDKFSQIKKIRKKYRVSRKKHSDIEIGLRLYNGWAPVEGGPWDYARAVLDIMRTKPWDGRKLK
jgi:hypothetical protein